MAVTHNDEALPVAHVAFSMFAAAVIAVQLASLSTFNLQPEIVHNAVAVAFLLSYIAMFGFAVLNASLQTIIYLLGFAFFAGNDLFNYARHPGATSLFSFARDAAGPIALIILTMRVKVAPPRQTLIFLWTTAIVTGLLAGGLALFRTPYVHHGARLALIAGGPDGLHPSGYAVTCFLLLLLVLFRSGIGSRWLTAPIAALMAVAVVGYEVRTTWLMLAVFGAYGGFVWLLRRSPNLAVAAVGAVLVIAAAAIPAVHIDLGQFSSGRTIVYQERLRLLQSRGPVDFLMGTGSGTDKMTGQSAWRYEAKDSHNDFITTTFEEGFLGLAGFLLMLGSVFSALPPGYRGWLLMFAFSSLVSNGILLRPAVGPPLVLIAYLAVVLRDWRPAPQPVVGRTLWREAYRAGDPRGPAEGLAPR